MSMSIWSGFELFAGWVVSDVFRVAAGTEFDAALRFFIADVLKIGVLLVVVVFAVGALRTFIPPERVRRIIAAHRGWGYPLAALLGTVTPFCSCSAVPLFLGFVQAGIPLGMTFTFLVASPMVNEVALALLLGTFGPRIALLYAGLGLVVALVSGLIIGRLNPERLLTVTVNAGTVPDAPDFKFTWRDRFRISWTSTTDILKRIWPYVLIGIAVGAWIHGYVPTDLLARWVGVDRWYAVPLATLIGIPLYSNAAGILPLVGVLTEKGIGLGTALAFMMSVTALSMPEFLILKTMMRWRLIAIFASVVGVGIMITGFMFNAVLR
jgi:uncharacterized protein